MQSTYFIIDWYDVSHEITLFSETVVYAYNQTLFEIVFTIILSLQVTKIPNIQVKVPTCNMGIAQFLSSFPQYLYIVSLTVISC